MRPLPAAAGTAVFLVLAPGTVAGLVPWWITGWHVAHAGPGWVPVQVGGVGLVVVGAAVVVAEFARFAMQGRGTPAPVAPTERLVVTGLYRYLRNPMYAAVVAIVVGQAMLFGHPGLLAYAAGAWATMAAFAHLYEEPVLRAQFGAQYDEYRARVPAWVPRRRP